MRLPKHTKEPNFFIIGAPKCGTTALSEYLREHPQIFMSHPKEPHHFSNDLKFGFSEYRAVDRYKKCFRDVASHHMAIGEASTFYLFSKNAVANILKFNPRARFIVMIRNPIELAYSLYSENYFHGDENVKDFEKAWGLQDVRKAGRRIPRICKEPALLQYGTVAKLGEQVERLFSIVSHNRVKVIFFDDFKRDTEGEYRNVLDFLDVGFDDRHTFIPENTSKKPRFDFLKKVFRVGDTIKSFFGIRHSFGILSRMVKLNTVNQKRPLLHESFIGYLIDYFNEDIKRLSRATNRDLSSWLSKDYYDYKK